MAPTRKRPRNTSINRLKAMEKNYNSKMKCFTDRLNEWSKVLQKQVFTFKTKEKYDENLYVMPVEEYFGYLFNVHFVHTLHGDADKMMEAISEEETWMPYEAVYLFERVCYECLSRRKDATSTDTDINRMRGFVEIIDMTGKPDGEYKYILHYKELGTQFSRLRALKSPLASEVAFELFRIFMTSGAPAILHSPDEGTFTKDIIENLEPLIPELKFLVGNRRASCKDDDKIPELVDKYLDKEPWSMGIYYVQADMNNDKKSNSISPYEALYNKKAGTGLVKRYDTPECEAVLKYLQNEEDLLLPSVEKFVKSTDEDLPERSGYINKGTEWCAVCGTEKADLACLECGVAFHLLCNIEPYEHCDCCKTTDVNHEHKIRDTSDSSQSVNASVTESKTEKVEETEVQAAKDLVHRILKTEKVASSTTQPSTSAQPIFNLKGDKIELKGAQTIGQYGKRKKHLEHDYSTRQVQNNTVKDDAVHVGDDAVNVGNETVNIGNESANVGNEHVNVKNEHVNVGNEHVNVENEHVNVGNEHVNVENEPANVRNESVNVGNEPVHVGN